MSRSRLVAEDFPRFARRVLFIAGIVVLIALAWMLRSVLIFAFAGALLALVLRTLAQPFVHWTPLGTGAAISVIVLLAIALVSGAGLVLGQQLSSQLGELWSKLPQFTHQAENFLQQTPIGRTLVDLIGDPEKLFSGLMTGRAISAATSIILLFADILVICFLGLFLAYSPRTYREGLVRLIPPSRRAVARRVLLRMGSALRSWLVGQFISMLSVGVITWLGLTLIGVPLALGLGFVAFLLEFIPVVGPAITAVPTILVGLSVSPTTALWVAGLFAAIHLIEGYMLVPLLQRWAVHVPPVLTVLAIVTFGIIFGWMGVLMATPLAVACIALVEELYLKDVLDERVPPASQGT